MTTPNTLALSAVFALCAIADPSLVQAEDTPPAAVLAHVDSGSEIVLWRRSDLDGDGRRDVLLVLQRQDRDPGDMDSPAARRTLKILVAQKSGGLRVAAVNDRVVLCKACGGVWPDPLDDVDTRRRSFTVSHYGGSRWRWSNSWRFDYAPVSRRWMLTEVTEGYDTEQDGHLVHTYRQGRHFRPVPLETFNPDLFHGQYLRKGSAPRPVRDESRS
jgi:hypothetical protein